MTDVKLIWDGGARLGEGPVWDAGRQCLWFVDIKSARVHRLDPATDTVDSWDAPDQIGWVLPAADGSLTAGVRGGLHRFAPEDGSFTLLTPVEADMPGNRLNDATVAADGAILFGSMDDGCELVTGSYYRWDGARLDRLDIAKMAITNGPAVSPDGRTLYANDTARGTIHAIDLDSDGRPGAARLFATIDEADGSPDGPSVDAAGNIWVALWGGWRARLYSPAGDILTEVELPVSNVTKVALGGPDLRTAYATSASIDLPEGREQPHAGGLFSFRVETPGLALPPAR